MQKKLWQWGLGAGILAGAIAACNPAPAPPPEGTAPGNAVEEARAIGDRMAYQEVDLPPAEQLLGATPEETALKAFGATDPGEGNFKEDVAVVEQTASQAVVALTQTGLADDSVEGMRYRLELEPEGEQWRLVWAGRQVRCRQGRGSQEWGTDLCS